MTTTVKQALYPLLVTCLVFGTGIYSREKMYLSILYNITIWIGYGYLYYYTVIKFEIENYYLSLFNLSRLGCEILTCIASIILRVFYDKRFQVFLKRLEAVDHTLAKLGTVQTYKQLHKYVKRMMIVWFIYCLIAIICQISFWTKMQKNLWCIIIPLVTCHMHHVNMIMNALYFTLLWYINTRFDEINKHMKCLVIEKEHELRCTWERPSIRVIRQRMKKENYKHIFWTLMHLHLELYRTARELNAMFETQLTLEILDSILHIPIMVVYNVAHIISLMTNDYTLPKITWTTYHLLLLLDLTRIFYLNYVCETVSAKAKQIEKVIHQMTYSFRYADMYDEIQQFILHISYHPLKFTGLGLFDFGYNFLRKFIKRTVIFVIFVIQSILEKKVGLTEKNVFGTLMSKNIDINKINNITQL